MKPTFTELDHVVVVSSVTSNPAGATTVIGLVVNAKPETTYDFAVEVLPLAIKPKANEVRFVLRVGVEGKLLHHPK